MSSAHHSLLHEGCTQQLLMASSISCQKHENGVNAINRILRCSAERSLSKLLTLKMCSTCGAVGSLPIISSQGIGSSKLRFIIYFWIMIFHRSPLLQKPLQNPRVSWEINARGIYLLFEVHFTAWFCEDLLVGTFCWGLPHVSICVFSWGYLGSYKFLRGDGIHVWLPLLLDLSSARRLDGNLTVESVEFLFTTPVFSMAPLPYLPLYI